MSLTRIALVLQLLTGSALRRSGSSIGWPTSPAQHCAMRSSARTFESRSGIRRRSMRRRAPLTSRPSNLFSES